MKSASKARSLGNKSFKMVFHQDLEVVRSDEGAKGMFKIPPG
jgi:hypothetical protein